MAFTVTFHGYRLELNLPLPVFSRVGPVEVRGSGTPALDSFSRSLIAFR
jgi:hypothetical protein